MANGVFVPSTKIILPSTVDPLLLAALVANSINFPVVVRAALTPGIAAALILATRPFVPPNVVTVPSDVTVTVLIVNVLFIAIVGLLTVPVTTG